MTTTAPSKVILTCTVTGKTVTWTNKKIIQKKIDQFGSLEAFVAQYKSKGTNKKEKVKKIGLLKPVLEEGVKIGAMTLSEYQAKYMSSNYTFKDGINCTVVVPSLRVAS